MSTGKNKDLMEKANVSSTIFNEEDDSLDIVIKNIAKKENATLVSEKRIARFKEVLEKDAEVRSFKAKCKNQAEYEAYLKKTMLERFDLARAIEDNHYKYASLIQKKEIQEERKQTALANQQKLKEAIAAKEAEIATDKTLTADARKAKEAEIRDLRELDRQAGQDAIKAEQQKQQLIKGTIAIGAKAYSAKMTELKDSIKAENEQHGKNIDNLNAQLDVLKEKKKLAEERGESTDEIDEEINTINEDKQKESDAINANAMKQLGAEIGSKVEKVVDKIAGAFDDAVNNAMNLYSQYNTTVSYRLQGTELTYKSLADTMKKNLAVSPFVRQSAMVQKLGDLVDKGIAYNVEQRAFLGTLSEKIVTTFDAFDSNLMRVIRLQQADTTAARMGMEASLNKFLNSMFSDSSYLSEGFDGVSQAIIDANAQLTRDMSVEFEYTVQKWLGSLSSLGFGTDTLTTIATGINYLGSGNVSALASNTQLQSLLAMAASRAGLSYGEMLTNGMSVDNTNALLKSMVSYLREIAEDENAAVKSAYGDIFNFTQADLRAIKNLSAGDISNIAGSSLSYGGAISEINNQLSFMAQNMSMSEKIDNVFDNFLYSTGESIASNVVSNVLWKVTDMIQGATGGINLPAVSVMGNMIDLSAFTVEGLMKTGIVGMSTLAQIPSIMTSISSGGGLSLSNWNADDYTRRGTSFSSSVKGVKSGTSSSSESVASSSSSDMRKESLSSATDDSKDVEEITQAGMDKKYTMDDFYKKTIEEKVPLATHDSQTHAVVNNILSKFATPIAVQDSSVLGKLNEVYSKLAGTLTVSLDKTSILGLTAAMPKSPDAVTVSGFSKDAINVYESLVNGINQGFQTSLTGQELPEFEIQNEGYTLKDLITYILDGGTVTVTNADTMFEYSVKQKLGQIERKL